MIPMFETISSAVKIPLIAKPNAGMPTLDEEGNTIYGLGCEDFAKEVKMLWERGASILGGCCGTTPKHIGAMISLMKEEKPVLRNYEKKCHVTSERMTVSFDINSPFMIIGERINPTGKKKLQEELRNGSMEKVLEFAEPFSLQPSNNCFVFGTIANPRSHFNAPVTKSFNISTTKTAYFLSIF